MESWKEIRDSVDKYLADKQAIIDNIYIQKLKKIVKVLKDEDDNTVKRFLTGKQELLRGDDGDNETQGPIQDYQRNSNWKNVNGLLLLSLPFRDVDDECFPIFLHQFCHEYPGIHPPDEAGTTQIQIEHIKWDNHPQRDHKKVHTIKEKDRLVQATTDFIQRLPESKQILERVVILILGHGSNLGTIKTLKEVEDDWIKNDEFIQSITTELNKNGDKFKNVAIELVFSHCHGYLNAGASSPLEVKAATSEVDKFAWYTPGDYTTDYARHYSLKALCKMVKQEFINSRNNAICSVNTDIYLMHKLRLQAEEEHDEQVGLFDDEYQPIH